MFGNIYGLDLGTYEIKVYDKKRMPYGEKKIQLLLQMKMRFFLWVTRHMRCLKKSLTI